MEIIWALASSLMFAGTFLLIKLGRESSAHLSVLWITLSINVSLLTLLNFFFVPSIVIDFWEWRYFIVAGLFAPLLGRLFQFIGMSSLGANVTTSITLTHPLFSVLIGYFILNERTTLMQLNGGITVVIGSLLIALSSQTRVVKVGKRVKFISLYSPFLASISYGVSISFRKIGIEQGTAPLLASAVTIITSWLVLSSYILVRNLKITCTKKEFKYFVSAGLLSSIGPVFLYMALSEGSLIVVAPLAATTPLMVFVGTWFMARSNEAFNKLIFAGVCLTMLGIVLLNLG